MMAVSIVVAGLAAFWLSRKDEVLSGNGSLDNRGLRWKSKFVVVLLSVGTLLLIWLPPRPLLVRETSLTHVKITLRRGGGAGAAPAYSITLRGDGAVTYFGEHMVGTRGSQTESISKAEIDSLGYAIDEIDFFEADDRIFPRCADAPWVLVSIAFDGIEKTVFAESCPTITYPAERKVVELARNIDDVARSGRWTSCNGPCKP
jgi:hypothetical protein